MKTLFAGIDGRVGVRRENDVRLHLTNGDTHHRIRLELSLLDENVPMRRSRYIVAESCKQSFIDIRNRITRKTVLCSSNFLLEIMQPGLHVLDVTVRGWILQHTCQLQYLQPIANNILSLEIIVGSALHRGPFGRLTRVGVVASKSHVQPMRGQ